MHAVLPRQHTLFIIALNIVMEHQLRLSDIRSTTRWSIATLWLAFVMLSSSSAVAQDPALQFAVQLGSGVNDVGQAIAVASNGDYYVTGVFNGIVDFDPGADTSILAAVDTGDAYVAKYDASGNHLWAIRVGGIGTGASANRGLSVAVDGGDNVVVVGLFSGTADFDPTVGVANRTARPGTTDMFIVKYSPAGLHLWSFGLPVSIETQYSKQHCLAIDSQNNIIVGGYFYGSVDFDPGSRKKTLTCAPSAQGYPDLFVARYTPGGLYSWAFRVGTSDWESVQALTVDANDDILITGLFGLNRTAVNFNPSGGTKVMVTPPGATSGHGDIFVAKYTPAGSIRWAFAVGGNERDRSIAITTDDDKNVVITGYFLRTVDFNHAAGVASVTADTTPYGPNIFVASYDSSGAYRWAFGLGAGWGSSLAVDENGDLLVTGTFACETDFDPGPGIQNRASAPIAGGCTWNCFVAGYTTSGAYRFAFGVPGTTGSPSHGMGIANDHNGHTYLTGYFGLSAGSSDFDPSDSTLYLISTGGSDIFVARYDVAYAPKRSVQTSVSNGMQKSIK